jgi:hypothetical protein
MIPKRILDEVSTHVITVGDLKRLLEELDDDLMLYPNRVGNLSITNSEGLVGYIDLHYVEQKIELFGESE